jgi:thiosulfate dehydrogenase
MAVSFIGLAFASVVVAAVTLTAIGRPQDRAPAPIPIAVAAASVSANSPTVPAPPAPATPTAPAWTVPDVAKLPNDEWGRTVRRGRDLITQTYALIGPEVVDPTRRFAGNNLSCQSCHLEAGTKQFGLPFQGVYADFPNYRARSGAVGTLEGRINGCMTRSMNGRALPVDGADMIAMVAYMKFLSTGRPVGAPTPGRGAGQMAELSRAADPIRGRTIYAQTCAACHGPNGAGLRVGQAGDAKGYTFPPLWGSDSFNNGAGMDRLISAANFVHSNMPNGTTWWQPILSVEDAWDVAAFVQSQPRPAKANLDRDYPNRSEKPVDTPYGPYADDLPPQVHELGPFAPIRAAIKQTGGASLTE